MTEPIDDSIETMNYFLPGMGATSAMYAGAWRSLPDTTFLEWPSDFTGDSLRDAAEYFVENENISEGDSMIGSSLGGMVACEIAALVDLNHLVLLGSARNREEVSTLLSILHPLIHVTPIDFIQRIAGIVPHDLTQMFEQADPKFIRTMCKAIFDWPGLQVEREVFRIHGKKDRVIPLPENVDLVLDAGHLIALSHDEACVEALKKQGIL